MQPDEISSCKNACVIPFTRPKLPSLPFNLKSTWTSVKSTPTPHLESQESVVNTPPRTLMISEVQKRCWVVVTLVFAGASGDFAARGPEWQWASCLVMMGVWLALALYARAAGITFGSCGLTRPQKKLEALVSVLYLMASLPWVLDGFFLEMTFWKELALYALSAHVFLLHITSFNSRTMTFIAGFMCALKGFVLQFGSYSNHPTYLIWLSFGQSGMLASLSFMKYQKEQISAAIFVTLIAIAASGGSQLKRKPARCSIDLFLILWTVYLKRLWDRRHRQLPPALKGRWRRPPQVFHRQNGGQKRHRETAALTTSTSFRTASEARYLIIVSHRWLNRLSCDVRTIDCPQGYRLQKMVDQLDSHFSERNFLRGWKDGGIREVWRRTSMSLTGGEDVLVFFDFMSLPQDGRNSDGTICKRTHQEEVLFHRCLPHMGALYSMFPVLICEDVVEGLRDYETSGWCFAEASTAWLGNQLSLFSSQTAASKWFDSWDCDLSDTIGLLSKLDEKLTDKIFFHEADRCAARFVLRGFVIKRNLVEAIQAKSLTLLEAALVDVMDGWNVLLDQPVDEKLNTPLHLAVAYKFEEGVVKLLEHGATPTLRNLFGDTPVQFLACPRMSRAAWICRHVKPKAKASRLPEEALYSSWYMSEKSEKSSCISCAEPFSHKPSDLGECLTPPTECGEATCVLASASTEAFAKRKIVSLDLESDLESDLEPALKLSI